MSCMHKGFLIITLWLVISLPVFSQNLPALDGDTIRILVPGDPFAIALLDSQAELEDRSGAQFVIDIVSYNDTRQIVLNNAKDLTSRYDIVALDVVWMGEYGADNILLPLDDYIDDSSVVQPIDFLQVAYEAGQYQNQQLALPIQPHPELIWYRRDVLEDNNLAIPMTATELLDVAQALTDADNNQYGICWNAQRGQALGQQMAHFYGMFGQALIDDNGNPTLNTPAGVAAAEFANDLLASSPPDILTMAWDQRIQKYSQGICMMTYGWGARKVDLSATNVQVVTGYTGAVAMADIESAVTPLGTWSLGIPANIGEREALAWTALEWLTSPDIQTLLAENGNGGMPRYSIMINPELQNLYPTFDVVYALDMDNQLADWMRPAISEWSDIARILGTVYHDMLAGDLTPQQAADLAQSQAEELMAESG